MRVLHSVRWWWLLTCLLSSMVWAQGAAHSPVTVRLLSQYDYPPFQTGAEDGLTFELADYLTRHANGAYRFVPEILPRKRLDLYLTDPGAVWVVPWAVPRFFGPDATNLYAWSPPYMADGNHLLTRKGRAVRYSGPESLAGLRFGATLGHRYGLLDPLVQAGRLTREDCYNLLCNVEKLKHDRVDFAWVPSGSIGYFRKQVSDFDASIEVSARPVESFERSFMLPKGQQALQRYLEVMVRKLTSDPAWKEALTPAGALH